MRNWTQQEPNDMYAHACEEEEEVETDEEEVEEGKKLKKGKRKNWGVRKGAGNVCKFFTISIKMTLRSMDSTKKHPTQPKFMLYAVIFK